MTLYTSMTKWCLWFSFSWFWIQERKKSSFLFSNMFFEINIFITQWIFNPCLKCSYIMINLLVAIIMYIFNFVEFICIRRNLRVNCKLLLKIRLFSIQIRRKYEQMEFSWMKNIFKSKKLLKYRRLTAVMLVKGNQNNSERKISSFHLWWFSGNFLYQLMRKRKIRFITIFDWDNSIFVDENRQRKWFIFVFFFLPNISLILIDNQPDVSQQV